MTNEGVPRVNQIPLDQALAMVFDEYQRAQRWPAMNSAHEGLAVLLEEVDELKAHVWTRQPDRDLDKLTKEAVQVAAMALRFIVDICHEPKARK